MRVADFFKLCALCAVLALSGCYDDRVTRLDINDELDADRFWYMTIGYESDYTMSMTSRSGNGETVTSAMLDSYGRLTDCVEKKGSEVVRTSSLTYSSDGLMKNIRFMDSSDSGLEWNFEHTGGALTVFGGRYFGPDYEDSYEYCFDPSKSAGHRYTDDCINVDLNTLVMTSIDDPDYFRHISSELIRTTTDDGWVKLNYEFDKNGCPTRIFAEIECEIYQVEYDLVAGDLIYENNYDDFVYRIYEVVMQNKTETYLRTAYATREMLITYR